VTYSKAALAMTESFEGCRLEAYQDQGGRWTIGYGHTRGVAPGMGCTREQAEAWLIEDLAAAEASVSRLVKLELTQGEFDALVDFEFNTGHLAGSTLLRLLNAGEIRPAAAEFAKWDHVNGKEVAGLLRRRLAEREEFNGGAMATSAA
jgi:lysozyme